MARKLNEALAKEWLMGDSAEAKPPLGKSEATYKRHLKATKLRKEEEATKAALKAQIKNLKSQVTRTEKLRKTRCAEFTKTEVRLEERIRRLHKLVAELKGQLKSAKTHKEEIKVVLSALDVAISRVLGQRN